MKFLKQKYFNSNGFTLIEVMVSVIGVSTMLTDIFSYSSQGLIAMDNIDQARMVSSTFVNEIRNATTGNNGSYPLNKVGDTEIIFYSNFKTSSPTIANRIRYFISDNKLYKGVVVPTGSPLAYNLSSESIKLVQSDVHNEGAPLFYYYDGNYDGSANFLVQPVNINQVRYVRINLLVLKQTKKGDSSVFPISTGATIRSIKDNLGN
jgi:Tfp pilus assembly major pilin PilA